jgi:hypothetical protein
MIKIKNVSLPSTITTAEETIHININDKRMLMNNVKRSED